MKKLLAVLALVLFGTVSYAQWIGSNPQIYSDPLYVNAKLGINVTNPNSTLEAFNPSGACSFLAGRNGGSVTDGSIATLTLRDVNVAATPDRFQFFFRKTAGQHEILMTTFTNSTTPASFREFSFFGLNTGLYQIRAGVNNIEFNNMGTLAIGMGGLAVPSGAKVAIGGKVVAKEIEVTLTGMPPDFVFNQDYKLASLYDVENFVNTNKHLPGVPSATEMTTNGLNVGDMNMTLLQKVEELTLYMINLQKENDALKSRVSQLEK